LDKLTAITYPSGNRVNYSYDATGFVSAINVTAVNPNGVGLSATTTTLIGTATYNADNNPSGWKWSDAKARTIGYDSVGQVASYTLGDPNGTGNAAGVLRTVSRDPAERITGYTHTNNGSAVTSLDQGFGYDNLNRLVTDTVSPSSTSYSYDETGNRTSKTIGGTTYTNTVASTSNRLTQTQDVGGTSSVSYDAAGNISGDGTNTYTYNDRGRMTSASTASGTVTFTYNGLNQRASKALGGASTYYVYDEAGQLVGEYDNTGAPVYETIYLGAMPVGALKQTGSAGASNIAVTLYNVDADQIAAPRMITKQDHTIVWRWDTAEAFGGTAPNQDPSGLGAFVFNQRFPGQVFDSETGLFQNRNREYQGRWGRYIQSDPTGLSGGINTYAYALSDPIRYADASGLRVELRCRRVGDPRNPDVLSQGAAAMGGEHCFVVVICIGKDGTRIPETSISYLGPIHIATNGVPSNNDTAYSSTGQYRNLKVTPSGTDDDCPSCRLEKCIVDKARSLQAAGYQMYTYRFWATNSNSFARRLVEACGAQVTGNGPITGWDNATPAQLGF
jgi:RHS repeat-associated protein